MRKECGHISFLEYAKMALSSVRFCNYTSEYSEAAKGISKHEVRLLTAEEHAQMSKMDFEQHFSSIDELIKWYFYYLSNIKKMGALTAIGELIKEGNARNIISFGAGPSVIEYFLKMIFQEDIHMVVTDYDTWMVEQVAQLMPNLAAKRFDFYHDDPAALIENNQIDTVIMLGSACSMDNEAYIKFLQRLHECGVRNVFTFEAGVKSWKQMISAILLRFLQVCKTLLCYFFARARYEDRKSAFLKNEQLCFHAYYRTQSELERIYSRGGYMFSRIGHVDAYPLSYRLTVEKDEKHD